MKIVVKNAQTNCYVAENGNYTPSHERARDFPSVTDAHRYCNEHTLRNHVLLMLQNDKIVSEVQLGNC